MPWNSAGTLCPVGDLFNYAPPGAPFEENIIETFSQCNLSEVHVQNRALPSEGIVSAEMQGCGGSKFDEVNYDAGRVLHITDRLTDGGYDATTRAYCFYAREDYKKGDQVLLCYGLYTNLELLEHYGFILPQNPNDMVSIRLHTLKSFTPDMVPTQLLNFNPHGSMHIEVDGRPSFQLLAALRLYCAPAEVRKQKGHLALSGQQLCVANDVVLYQKLQEECMNLLASFPTTMYVDNVLMHVVSLCSSIDGLAGLLDLLGHQRVLCQAGHKLLADSVCGWSVLCASNQQQVLGEVQSFLESQEGSPRTASSKREGDLQMQRWWLSIKWRFCHKRILHRCISFCGHQLQLLSQSKKTKGDTS